MVMAICSFITGHAIIPVGKTPVNVINLRFYYDDGDGTILTRPRTPIRMPEVYLSESTIIFENGVFCDRIVLVDADNNIVYDVDTTEVSGDSIALPSYLTGEYGIYFICENYYFYGEIEL